MQKNKKNLEFLMTLMILAASFYIGRLGAGIVEAGKVRNEEGTVVGGTQGTIVIDAGHGGMDAGKVGTNGTLEKEINLQIAKMLQEMLEEEGFRVVMTRETDAALYDEDAPNKKQQDMKRRCELIEEVMPLMTVSIHQNSYTDPSVEGPQVFYYGNSASGREIAAALQSALNEELAVSRPREIKANDSYYLLRKTTNPTVIVECGFLSNPGEAGRLITQEYQEKVARALCDGILECAVSCTSLNL